MQQDVTLTSSMNKNGPLLHIDIGGSYIKIGLFDSILGKCTYKIILTIKTPDCLDDVCELVISAIKTGVSAEVGSLKMINCLIGVPGVSVARGSSREEWIIPHLGQSLNLEPLKIFLLGKVLSLIVVNDALALLKIVTLQPLPGGNHVVLSFGTSLGCAFKCGSYERSLELAHSPLLLHEAISVEQYVSRFGVTPQHSQQIKCLDLFNGDVLHDLIQKSLESPSKLEIQAYFFSLFSMLDVVLASESVKGFCLVHLYGSLFNGFSRPELDQLLSGLTLESLIENQYFLASINFKRLPVGG